MNIEKDKEIIAKIKNHLQNPKTLIEMMKEKGVNRNGIPMEFIDDALKAIDKSVRLLNRLAKWK